MLAIVILALPLAVLGQTASESAAPLQKDIKKFEDKVANKIAEITKNKKAVAGTITQITPAFKIKTSDDVDYDIKIDEALTKFYQITGTTKKELKLSDLEKGDYIIITGPVTDKTISANFVYIDEQFLTKSGKVTDINTDNETINLVSSEKDNYTLDVTNTRLQILNSKTLEIESTILSKIKEGDTIHFVVKKTGQEKEKNHFPAYRILIIPQEYFTK